MRGTIICTDVQRSQRLTPDDCDDHQITEALVSI